MPNPRRQAFWNLVVLLAGTALGALNYLVLLPRALGAAAFGVVVVVGSLATIGQQFASLGMPYVVLRYFPALQSQDGRHRGFVLWVLAWAGVGYGLLVGVYVLARPWLLAAYAGQSALVNDYLGYTLPLAALLLALSLLETLLGSLMRTVFNGFVREVLLRLLTALGLLVVLQGWLSFKGFLLAYLIIHALAVGLLVLEVARSRGARLATWRGQLPPAEQRNMLRYGLLLLAAGGLHLVVLQHLDKAMLPGYVTLAEVGYYGIYGFLGLAVQLPAKAILRITRQLAVQAWHLEDWPTVKRLYQRSSLVQLALSSVLLLLLLVNRANLAPLLGQGPAFAAAFPVFIWLGISYWADAAAGLNFILLASSRHYRWDLYFTLFLAGLNMLLNLWLLPRLGILGAAISTAASFACINAAKCWVLWHWYRLQPLTLALGDAGARVGGAAHAGLRFGGWATASPGK
jgi:O-antigen/teichoic acid export membrane protein